MNNKVKLITATVAVGMAAALSGCGGCFSCSGCNGTTAYNALTRSNWFTGTTYSGIQPSFIEGHDVFSPEVITYDVTYSNADAENANVSLDYRDGTFRTEFYAFEYDWASPSIPAGYAPEYPAKEILYCYKTELAISVKFTMKTGDKAESDWFDDSVETVSYFRAAGKNLQPVYSKQVIKSTSPATYQPATLKDAYKEVDVAYENFYNYSCTRVFSITTQNGHNDSKEFTDLNKVSYTLFDNSSLYIAARSMNLSSSLAETVSLFSPAAGGVDTYAIVGSDSGLTVKERTAFTAVLSDKGLYISSGEDDKGVDTTAVTLSFAGGDLHGTSQTVWYASITDTDNNVSRATMLKLSVPLSFSLGTLNYTIKEIGSTLWNG